MPNWLDLALQLDTTKTAPAQTQQQNSYSPPQGWFDFAIAPPAPPPPPPKLGFFPSMGQGFADSFAMDFADEAEGVLRSGDFSGPEYERARDKFREDTANSANLPYYLGYAGGLVQPGALGAKGLQLLGKGAAKLGLTGAKGTAARYSAASGVAATEGAIAGYGSGETPEERMNNALTGGVVGGAVGPVGEAAASGVTKFLNRNVVRDIDKFDPAKVKDLQAKAEEWGIQLTPAELTNLSSLMADQKILSNIGTTADDMKNFITDRYEGQISPAIDKFLNMISVDRDLAAAGERMRNVSKSAVLDATKARADQAKPLYDKAFSAGPMLDSSNVLREVDDLLSKEKKGTPMHRMLTEIRPLFIFKKPRLNADGTVDEIELPEDDPQMLHSVSRALGGILDRSPSHPKSYDATVKYKLTQVKNKLRDVLHTNPDYAAASAIYSDTSPGIDRIREGVAGVISDLPDMDLRLAASKLFDRNAIDPRTAREGRAVLQQKDPQAWQMIKGAFLQDTWLEAQKETMRGGPNVNAGAKWRQRLLGNKKQYAILKEVLEPEELSALETFSEVLEAAGRVEPLRSDTTWNTERLAITKDNSRGLLARAMDGMSWAGYKEIRNFLRKRDLENYADRMYNMITSPNGIELLKELKRSPIRRQMQLSIIANAMGLGATQGVVENPEENN